MRSYADADSRRKPTRIGVNPPSPEIGGSNGPHEINEEGKEKPK
jgi:hypothetical protein